MVQTVLLDSIAVFPGFTIEDTKDEDTAMLQFTCFEMEADLKYVEVLGFSSAYLP